MSLHIWHKNSKFKSIRSRYRKYFGSLNFVEIGLDMGSTLVYHLTPSGLEQKARITARFLKRKLSEYEEIKSQIKEIASEAEKDGSIDLLSDDTLKRLSSTH